MSSRSSSSRRSASASRRRMEPKSDDDSDEKNGVDSSTSDEEDSEPVKGKGKAKEMIPEYSAGKRRSIGPDPLAYLSSVTCTACHKQINTSKKGAARRHPDLNVLICKRCREYHESGPITKDKDGLDEQCRWCSEGGRLFGCDYCHNTFCRACIIHNLGRAEVRRVDGEDKWKCYVCNPKPLANLVKQCRAILEKMKEEEQKEKQRKEKEKEKEKEKAAKEAAKKKQEEKEKTEDKKISVNSNTTVAPKTSTKNTPVKVTQNSAVPSVASASTTTSVKTVTSVPTSVRAIIVTPSSAIKSNVNRPTIGMSNPIPNNIPIAPKPGGAGSTSLMNMLSRPIIQPAVTVNNQPRTNLPVNNAGSSALPELFAQFRRFVNEHNVGVVMDKMLKIVNSLSQLLTSVRANVTPTSLYNNPMQNNMSRQSRRMAVECMMNGTELFLQELNLLMSGSKGDFQSAKLTAEQSATQSNSSADKPALSSLVSILPKSLTQPAVPDVTITDKQDAKKVSVDLTKNTEESKTNESDTKKQSSDADSSCVVLDNDADSSIEVLDSDSEKNKDVDNNVVIKEDDFKVVLNESFNSDEEENDKSKENKDDTGDNVDKNKKLADKNSEGKDSEDTEEKHGDKESKADRNEDVEMTDRNEDVEMNSESDLDKTDSSVKKKSDNNVEGKSHDKEDEMKSDSEDSNEDSDDSDDEDSSDESDDSGPVRRRSPRKKKVKDDKKTSKNSKAEKPKLRIKLSLPKKKPTAKDVKDKKSEEESSSKTDKDKKGKNKEKTDTKNEENSDASISDLEEEVKKLSESPRLTRRSKRSSTVSSQEEEPKQEESKNDKAGKDKKGKKTDKEKKKEQNSDSSVSDLEEEVKKLSESPKLTRRSKRSSTVSSQEEEPKPKDLKKEKGKGSKDKKDADSKKSKTKEQEKAYDDSTDDEEDNTDDYDPGDLSDEDDPTKTDGAEAEVMENGNADDVSENEKAKEDLLKELDDSSNSEDSSDSEVVINSPKKRVTRQRGKKKQSDSAEEESEPKKKGKGKKADSTESEEDSDFAPARKKKKRVRSKLLDAKLSESDSESEVQTKKRGKKRKAETESSEESDESSDESSDEPSKKKKGRGKKNEKGKKNKDKKKTTRGKKRRRIKQQTDSSEEQMSTDGESEEKEEKEGEDSDAESPTKGGRKKIRKVLSDKKLKDKTKAAVKAEEERRQRVIEKQKLFNNINIETVEDPSSPTKCPITKKLVLEMDKDKKEPVIDVHKELVTKLKPHQVEAVQFIWDCTIESLDRLKGKGAGCILAHCMGLGKTLSVITYLHTVMNNYDKTKLKRVLVVCPLNTVLNWQYEFEMWVESFDEDFYEVFELASVKLNSQRADLLRHWHKEGGIMILGYEMFRNLTQGKNCKSKKQKTTFRECLVDPGPDICVCDEGHILKNDGSAIARAMNEMKTLRRIVLTGTPLQNNLIEYHCMVNFVKPDLLGTKKEFLNRFVNPIVNGQCADSTSHDVRLMKRRAHVLHEKLAGCVQRKDYSALTKYLAAKYEYVISVRLSKVQMTLYEKYLDTQYGERDVDGKLKGAKLFSDYQALMRIWTHPWVLKMDEQIKEMKAMFNDDESSFIDSGSDGDSDGSEGSDSGSSEISLPSSANEEESDSNGKRKTRRSANSKADSKDKDDKKSDDKNEVVKKWTSRSRGGEMNGIEIPPEPLEENKKISDEWWAEYVTEEDEFKMELSGKLHLLFEILKMCEEIGDKVLVFSQSLLSLDLIEKFLERVDEVHQAETAEKDQKKTEEKEAKKKKNQKGKKSKEEDTEEEDEESDKPVFGKHWTRGEDFFRMDGSTSAQTRKDLAAAFNDPENYRARLFIISTKAGGLGINLVAANRVIIFDASWNPSHDIQSIFRVYRFGQDKPVYVYRFLAQGTMEEKIYERQVTKQSLSQRVIDEHQIERHFNARDLQELYSFKPDRLDDPDRTEKPTPALPKDHLLAELLKSQKDWIVNYHEHDSLLENQIDQELSEEERQAAWKDYEEDKKNISNTIRQSLPAQYMQQMVGNYPRPNIMGMQGGMGGYMGMPGIPGSVPLNQHNLLQLVQDMKTKYPHLPEDQLTARVQSVIRQIITNQFLQQQDMQRRQLEQREIQHQQQLQRIQAQILKQQQQLGQMPGASAGPRNPGPNQR